MLRGGRGASFQKSTKAISDIAARVSFNSAKRDSRNVNEIKRNSSYEREIIAIKRELQKGSKPDAAKFMNGYNEKQIRAINEYVTDRITALNHKISKLGDYRKLQNKPELYYEKQALIQIRLGTEGKLSGSSEKTVERINTISTERATTTYDRARRRRINNYDAWFFGNSK